MKSVAKVTGRTFTKEASESGPGEPMWTHTT
jgi:hypothetical protein